jgi:hypothetical protein
MKAQKLKSLWENPNNVHLKLLPNSERDVYKVDDINARMRRC